MRHDPTNAELAEHEIETEAHRLAFDWRAQYCGPDWSQYRGAMPAVEAFAEWMLARKPPAGDSLRALAERLTPNPALTVDGTLAVILDGIDRLDSEKLARSLAQANARQAGLDAPPLTDEQWRAGDIQSKLNLIRAVQALKEALRTL